MESRRIYYYFRQTNNKNFQKWNKKQILNEKFNPYQSVKSFSKSILLSLLNSVAHESYLNDAN